ncbi:DUF4123 domain-containing protein [Aeromonas jandaei]|uniref:DUF4123 domain-containing protein n=1 Tax=Aeromonas jandaei TaxID=650 RepID=UPI001C04B146|nr:DUF4123 domain-containing protein [Aeromonas jandaei]MBW3760298.1 DUF4123 domain-containing protein [Aeromonas jandaei]QWL65692.1 DUF4123 domain-containing protein [Aeromonas jandaei]
MQTRWEQLTSLHRLSPDSLPINYLLIDVARWEEAQEVIHQLIEQPELTLLFAGTHHQALLEVSPLLLSLPSERTVRETLLTEVRERRAGVALRASLSCEELANHFRQFLTVPDGQGQSYLRFYDPAIWLAIYACQYDAPLVSSALEAVYLPDWCSAAWCEIVSAEHEVAFEQPVYLSSELLTMAQKTRLLYSLQAARIDPVLCYGLASSLAYLIEKGLTEQWELMPWLTLLNDYPAPVLDGRMAQWLATFDIECHEPLAVANRFWQHQTHQPVEAL